MRFLVNSTICLFYDYLWYYKFCKKSLKKGTCVGLLAKVYGDDNFDDKPFGRFINHSKDYNLDLKVIRDVENKIIYVIGISNRYIKTGKELTANYLDRYAPKPNFITRRSYRFEDKLNELWSIIRI